MNPTGCCAVPTSEFTQDGTIGTVAGGSSAPSASALVIAAADKAGMEGIDRSRIDAIILRESGNSAFIKQQQQRDEQVNKKIQLMKERLKKKCGGATDTDCRWKADLKQAMESEVEDLLSDHHDHTSSPHRRRHCTCVVVDMDMFYMACELLGQPELANRPSCVGGTMILTSNYCARRYGVRSAMAGWIGDALVHELSNGRERLVHVPANYSLYKEKANQVRQVLGDYDPKMRCYSLDEAYLDIGNYVSLYLRSNAKQTESIHEQSTHDEIVRTLRALHSSAGTNGSGEKNNVQSDRQNSTSPATPCNLPNSRNKGRKADSHDDEKKPCGWRNDGSENNYSQSLDISDEDETDGLHSGIDGVLSENLRMSSPSKAIETHSPNTTACHNSAIPSLNSFPPHVVLAAATKVVSEMRRRVFDRTGGLTCSAGLANNFMLSKIASDRNKPNGQCVVGPCYEKDIVPFLHPLPIRKVPGIGRVMEKMLQAFDICTVHDLYQERALVRFLFPPATGSFLLRASLGCSSSSISGGGGLDSEDAHDRDTTTREEEKQRGISRERTFRSGESWGQVVGRLHDLCHLLYHDMKRKDGGSGLQAHTLTLKVKLDTFVVLSRSKTIKRQGKNPYSGSSPLFGTNLQDMIDLAIQLLTELRMDQRRRQKQNFRFSVRLLGVRCSNFGGCDHRGHVGSSGADQTNIQRFLSSPSPTRPKSNPKVISPKKETLSLTSPASTINQKKDLTIGVPNSKKANQQHLVVTIPASGSNNSCQEAAVANNSHAVMASKGFLISEAENDPQGKEQSSGHSNFTDLKQHLTGTIPSVTATTVARMAKAVQCPICELCLGDASSDNVKVNEHIDSCLSGDMVRKVLQEDMLHHQQSTANTSTLQQQDKRNCCGKRKRLTDFFSRL